MGRSGAEPEQRLTSSDDIVERSADPFGKTFERLPVVRSIADVHGLIDEVTGEVEQRTSCMLCDEGCADCCEHQVVAGHVEWSHALHWIKGNLSVEEQRRIVRRAENLRDRPSSVIKTWLGLSGIDPDGDRYRETVNYVFANTSTPCPFLVGGRCSIYEVRPSICRAYGRMMRTADEAYYCDHISERIVEWPPGMDQIELPVFQGYHHAALTLDGTDLDEVNLLPVWVLSHRADDGSLVDQPRRHDDSSGFPVVHGWWAYDDGGGA